MTEESNDTTSASEKKDLIAGLKGMPKAEKWLAAAAATCLLAFVFDSRWNRLFSGKVYSEPWMHTLAFLGSIGLLTLIITRLLGIKVVSNALHPKLVVLCGVLPALGLIIDQLRQRRTWGVLLLASIFVMAYAAAKITTRDKILK